MTSTYDHRIIQGAESGQFLQVVEAYLQDEHGFYEQVFSDLGVEMGAGAHRTNVGVRPGCAGDSWPPPRRRASPTSSVGRLSRRRCRGQVHPHARPGGRACGAP